MISEFALDPAVVNDWPSFKYIVDQCGVHHGRLISGFPGSWQRMALNLCQIQGTKRTAIVEKLRNMRYKMMNSNRIYNDQQEWIVNAEQQHCIKPFHAIITTPNPTMDREYVLIADDIEENTPLWNVRRGKPVPRTAKALAECAFTLLSISKEIIFIDRHFDVKDNDGKEIDRFINTLRYFINFSFINKPVKRIELHLRHNKRHPIDSNSWENLCAKIAPLIPKCSNIKVFIWKKKWDGDEIHARYILTERGGIRYDYGLDEGWKGETTDVDLLDEKLYEERWKDFQEDTAAFKLVDKMLIEGTRD